MQIDHPIGEPGIEGAQNSSRRRIAYQSELLAGGLNLNHEGIPGMRGKTNAAYLRVRFRLRDLTDDRVQTYDCHTACAPWK